MIVSEQQKYLELCYHIIFKISKIKVFFQFYKLYPLLQVFKQYIYREL